MLKKIFKTRVDIIRAITLLLFAVLIFRLAELQIVEGEYYLKRSETLRTRSVGVSAPRGNIVDKFGRLLAGNKQSYSVNILKADLPQKTIDDIALAVINIIEENGDSYKDEIPIFIDPVRFKFQDNEELWKTQYNIPLEATAKEALAKLRQDYTLPEDISDEEAYQLLKKDYGVILPFDIATFQFDFYKEEVKWKTANGFNETDTAEQVFSALLDKYKIPRDQYGDLKSKKILAVKYLLGKNTYKEYEPVEIAVDISEQTRAKIEENKFFLKGVEILEKPLREYPGGQLASHILGYMSKIGTEIEVLSEKGYTPLDMIGKSGIEASMEQYLKGTDGKKMIEVDAGGGLINTIDQEEPTPGSTVFLTIDKKLQQVAEESLRNAIQTITAGDKANNIDPFVNARTGAAVAIDVNSGRILAMASEPGYDPNLFAGGISSEDWELLQPKEKGRFVPRPLINNAISGVFPPGSTLKMLTGLAGLDTGAVTVSEKINDIGPYLFIPGISPSCSYYKTYRIGHGLTDMLKAIKVSCNYYFFEVGRRMGIEVFERYSEIFGFGKHTGVELPAEEKGSIEGPKHQKEMYKGYLKSYLTNTVKITDENIKREILTFIDNETKPSEVNKRLQELGVTRSYKELQDKFAELGYNKKYSTIAYKVREYQTKDQTVDNIAAGLGLQPAMANYESIRDIIGEVIRNVKIEDRISNYISNSKWRLGQITSAAIGQGATDATPLQVANYIAMLVNGGTRYKPYIVDKIVGYDGKIVLQKQPEIVEKIDIKPEYLDVLKKGMYAVVNEEGGTARRRFIGSKVITAGKTGTAQVGGNYDAHAWYVAFAPYDNPEIAVVAVITQGGHGDYAAPIARAILEQYLAAEDSNDKITYDNEILK
ncbi:MAG: penicillin-binding transpeptidase domain-containing protein [Bacillota bacterium]